jgi:hypothetical protein
MSIVLEDMASIDSSRCLVFILLFAKNVSVAIAFIAAIVSLCLPGYEAVEILLWQKPKIALRYKA